MGARTSAPNRNGTCTTNDQRFRRSQRLLDANAFGRVFRRAKRSRDSYFTVLYRNNGRNPARLGLAIGKKRCRLSTDRNRIKRAARESFRRHAKALIGLDLIVINTNKTHLVTNRLLADSLSTHWKRLAAGHAKPTSEREHG